VRHVRCNPTERGYPPGATSEVAKHSLRWAVHPRLLFFLFLKPNQGDIMAKEVIFVKKPILNELSGLFVKSFAATAGALAVVVLYAFVSSKDDNEDQNPNKTKK